MSTPKEFRVEHVPVAYLITFRTYGSWLHGRAGSVDRFHRRYGTPTLIADRARWKYNRRLLTESPLRFSMRERAIVEKSLRETCDLRKWSFWIANVRTNHVHVVVTANVKPELVMNAFKANATRKLREAGMAVGERTWARGGSKRYLWTEKELVNAITYVQDDQGE